ncbi:hypothetical protein H9P43_000971 [Blastocladiella emersonii ATCC 22665]|nr:hypothetical protein H9P43_000971 [Blastocladiella emersonii ATCC 22665]
MPTSSNSAATTVQAAANKQIAAAKHIASAVHGRDWELSKLKDFIQLYAAIDQRTPLDQAMATELADVYDLSGFSVERCKVAVDEVLGHLTMQDASFWNVVAMCTAMLPSP